jgi:hypothetical protein
MKKITVLAAFLFILTSSVIFSKPAHAATVSIVAGSNGPNCSDGGYFKLNGIAVTSIIVTAGDTITFSVPANDPYAPGLEIHNIPGGNFTILPGQSHTTGALLVDIPNLSATWPSSGCQKGSGTVTVKQPVTPPPSQSPNPTPPPPAPTPTPVAPAPVPPPPPNKPPQILTLDKAALNGEKFDTAKPVTIDVSKSITISGYTIANGVVNLTIHSVVRNEIARANAAGFWSYDISGLEPGNHTIDATVTDLSTHLTSPSTTLLKFAVTEQSANKVSAQPKLQPAATVKNHANKTVQAILLLIVILSAAVAAIYWFKKMHSKPKKPGQQKPTQAPPPTEIAPSV